MGNQGTETRSPARPRVEVPGFPCNPTAQPHQWEADAIGVGLPSGRARPRAATPWGASNRLSPDRCWRSGESEGAPQERPSNGSPHASGSCAAPRARRFWTPDTTFPVSPAVGGRAPVAPRGGRLDGLGASPPATPPTHGQGPGRDAGRGADVRSEDARCERRLNLRTVTRSKAATLTALGRRRCQWWVPDCSHD